MPLNTPALSSRNSAMYSCRKTSSGKDRFASPINRWFFDFPTI
ncbi:MAG: hypothetical protein ACOYOU_09345 [Kiritimatiellia bacterium]